MKANKILFVTQEIDPYVPESQLTDLGRKVPLATIDMGREIRTFMPKWGNINERRNQLHEVIRLSRLNLTINKNDHPLIIKVASLAGTRMQIYFIDSEDFFAKRLQECDDKGEEYNDNALRAVFYARSVLDTVKKLRWIPDVIHCQGWISAIVPVYLKVAYAEEPAFANCKLVYTQCDNKLTYSTGENFAQILEYRAAGEDTFKELGKSLTPKQMEMLAMKYADGITFNSPKPDDELYEYAKRPGKPIMELGDTEPKKFVEFFDFVCGE